MSTASNEEKYNRKQIISFHVHKFIATRAVKFLKLKLNIVQVGVSALWPDSHFCTEPL